MMLAAPDPERLRELLTRAAKKIADPVHWCQGALARDKTGTPLSPIAKRAVRWCPIGSLYWAARADPEDEERGKLVPPLVAYLNLAASVEHHMTMEGANDALGHAAAMTAMRRAYRLIGNSILR